MNTQTVIERLEAHMRQAWDAGDRPTVDFWSGAIAHIKSLDTIANAAAQVYRDQSVDGVWESLFDALASTDYLDAGGTGLAVVERSEVWVLHREAKVLCQLAGIGVPTSAVMESDGTIGGTVYRADDYLGPFDSWSEATQVAKEKAVELSYQLQFFDPFVMSEDDSDE